MLKQLASRSTYLFDLHQRRKNVVRVPFVQKYLPKHGVGAELGVFRGDFSPLLFRETQPSHLHLVDPWYLLTSHWHWGPGTRSTVDGLIVTLRKMKDDLPSGKISIHVSGSVEFLNGCEPNSLDWVYIDSSHEYEHTCTELSAASSKMRPSGIIAGDDWQHDSNHRHHGVLRAVKEFCDKSDYQLVYASNDDCQWAIARKT